MLVSITGKLGSGKSTICGKLQDKYGFEKIAETVMKYRISISYISQNVKNWIYLSDPLL